ncbi:MAG: tripartite tricarboxylate transporter TctB family protein [Deltaproteobacteria bacterium]|nr:tripartite tricarboxylate transporter TctB family protein [Deltaproteobacteria bacterium]
MEPIRRGELIFRGACLLFFAALLPWAWNLGGIRRLGEVGSGFWPLSVLSLATALSALVFFQGLRSYLRAAHLGDKTPPQEPRLLQCLVAMATVLVYLAALPWTGFVSTTPLFIVVFMLGLGEKRVSVLVTAPVLITPALFLFFIKFVSIPLPRGSGVFLTFSRMLY